LKRAIEWTHAVIRVFFTTKFDFVEEKLSEKKFLTSDFSKYPFVFRLKKYFYFSPRKQNVVTFFNDKNFFYKRS